MQPKTEELLYLLLWSAEMLIRPNFRNVTESFEGWAYRKGLMRQLATLERRAFLERDASRPKDRIYRLTEQGRLHALGGRDPQAQWSRHWDQNWRLVLFDVPVGEGTRRNKLRHYLRDRGFGCLQGSVWITPDSLSREREILTGEQVNAASLILLEGRPCGEESDEDLVSVAWDFEAINARYTQCLEILEKLPTFQLKEPKDTTALQHWARQEREAWLAAVAMDPLLPQRLLPQGYLGLPTWHRRTEVLTRAGRQLQGFVG
jgi:phenylacetic acid degradation operon negative regulatory protein